jgi:Glyoxalase/Bleomycin resistance protein/Dioxygenase superfamily
VLLEEVLKSGDLASAGKELAAGFRARFGLPPLYELGLVVPDAEKAAADLEAQGVRRFLILGGRPVLWQDRGEEGRPQGKMGLAFHQGVELELLEPMQGSTFYDQAIDVEGRPVVHHLGFLVNDVDGWAGKLTAAGFPVWVRGRLQLGPLRCEFAYMDTVADAGVIIEFIDWRLFGRAFSPPATVLGGLAQLVKWSGRRSVPV